MAKSAKDGASWKVPQVVPTRSIIVWSSSMALFCIFAANCFQYASDSACVLLPRLALTRLPLAAVHTAKQARQRYKRRVLNERCAAHSGVQTNGHSPGGGPVPIVACSLARYSRTGGNISATSMGRLP